MESTLSGWLHAQIQGFDTNAYGIRRAIGVTPRTVYKWLDGTHTPSPDNCRKLADFFGVPEQHVLVLAGHLSANPGATHESPLIYTTPDDPDLGIALRLFQSLPPDDRLRILTIMRALKGLQHD